MIVSQEDPVQLVEEVFDFILSEPRDQFQPGWLRVHALFIERDLRMAGVKQVPNRKYFRSVSWVIMA